MGKVRIVNNILRFTQGFVGSMDRALNRMAIDIERVAKQRVPLKHGQLRSSGHHEKVANLVYHTIFNKTYARFQEFGGDEKRKVKKYSKEGTGKFYLKSSGDDVSKFATQYLKQEAGRIKI